MFLRGPPAHVRCCGRGSPGRKVRGVPTLKLHSTGLDSTGCSDDEVVNLAVSAGGHVAFVASHCGFDDDAGLIFWWHVPALD